MKFKSAMFFHSAVWKWKSGMGHCVVNIRYIKPRMHFREIRLTKERLVSGEGKGFQKQHIF